MFPPTVYHRQQSNHKAGPKEENQESQNYQHDRSDKGEIIQPRCTLVIKESNQSQQDQLDEEFDYVAERNWYARLFWQCEL